LDWFSDGGSLLFRRNGGIGNTRQGGQSTEYSQAVGQAWLSSFLVKSSMKLWHGIQPTSVADLGPGTPSPGCSVSLSALPLVTSHIATVSPVQMSTPRSLGGA
jgi:hypothetical protein